MTVQIPLPFKYQEAQDFDTFYPGPNREIVESLQKNAINCREQLVFIWGESGLGKTHLLQASCKKAHESNRTAMYIPLRQIVTFDPALLDEIDRYTLVCIDDIQTIAGDTQWEPALFNFFNRHRDNGHRLVICADLPPNNLAIQLPDLATRLLWGVTLRMNPLNDSDKIQAMIFKAKALGFDLPTNVGRYLLNRYARDMPSLWFLLENLERGTLIAQRKLTIPFVKKYLMECGQQ